MSGRDGCDGPVDQEEGRIALTLGALDDEASGVVKAAHPVRHRTQRRVRGIEGLVIVREVTAAEVRERCQLERGAEWHALCHGCQEELCALIECLRKWPRRGIWHRRRGVRRRRRHSADHRSESVPNNANL